MEILAGAGHMLPIERARDVADRILRFVEGLGVDGSGAGGDRQEIGNG